MIARKRGGNSKTRERGEEGAGGGSGSGLAGRLVVRLILDEFDERWIDKSCFWHLSISDFTIRDFFNFKYKKYINY